MQTFGFRLLRRVSPIGRGRDTFTSLFQILLGGYVAAMCCSTIVFAQSVPAPGPGTTNLLSLNAQGEPANATSGRPLISSNGRLVVFESDATNLISDDSNGKKDIFLRNQKTGDIRRVSEGFGRSQPDAESFDPSVSPESPNGFVAVAYASEASNINFPFPGLRRLDNGVSDIFVTLPDLDFTMQATYGIGLRPPDGASSHPSVTIVPAPNRVVVAYASEASNLVSGDANDMRDVFITTLVEPGPKDFDLQKSVRTIKISTGFDGTDANGPSDRPRISGDGRYIVFESEATNLISDQTPAGIQIYLYDTVTQTTSLVSKSSSGLAGNGDSVRPSINFPGNVIGYKTAATNILNDGLSPQVGAPQFVVFDTKDQTNTRVNTTPTAGPSNGTDNVSLTSELSPSGRLVFFADNGSNLASADTNGKADIFVRDTASGELFRVSRGQAGAETDGDSLYPSFGQLAYNSPSALVVFQSNASNLTSSGAGVTHDYITDYRIPPREIEPGTRIDLPPDVTIKGKKLKISFEEFSGVNLSSLVDARATKKASGSIRYRVTVKKVSDSSALSRGAAPSALSIAASTSDIIRKTTKKTSVTVSKLSSGTYTTSYRTSISRTSSTQGISTRGVFNSDPSPSQRLTIE